MMQSKPSPFANSAAIESYTLDAPRKVPGLADLHRMTMLLLAEQASDAADVLVVGAGGGMETKLRRRNVPFHVTSRRPK